MGRCAQLVAVHIHGVFSLSLELEAVALPITRSASRRARAGEMIMIF